MFWVLRYSGNGRNGAHRGGRKGGGGGIWTAGPAQALLGASLRLYTETATTAANVSPFEAVLPLSLWGVH